MSTTQKTGVTIDAKVNGASEFAKLAKENERLKKSLESSSAALAKQKAAIAGATKEAANGSAITKVADAYNEIGQALNTLQQQAMRGVQMAGAEANFRGNIEKMRAATRGLVSDFDLMRMSNQAMALGVAKNGDEVVDLMASSQAIATKLGQDVGQTMDSLTGAIGRQSPLLLDNLGIIMKQEQAQELYARSIGKTVNELTAEEKATAFRAEAMKAVKKSATETNASIEDATLSIAQMTVQLQNAADAALLLPKYARELELELRDALGIERDVQPVQDRALNVQREMVRLAHERSTGLEGFLVGYYDLLGAELNEEELIERNVGLIDKLRLNAGERLIQEQKVAFSYQEQLTQVTALGGALASLGNAQGEQKKALESLNVFGGLVNAVGKPIKAAAEGMNKVAHATVKAGKAAAKLKAEIVNVSVAADASANVAEYHAKIMLTLAERRAEILTKEAEIEATVGEVSRRRINQVGQAEGQLYQARLNQAYALADVRDREEAAEQVRHDATMARLSRRAAATEAAMEKIKKAEEDAKERHEENEAAVIDASHNTVSALGGLATARKKDAVAATKINQAAAAADLMIDGYQYSAKAAAAFAALRPVQGAAFALAAGIAFAKSAEIATRPIAPGTGVSGGGSSGSSNPERGGSALNPRTGGGGGQAPPQSDIPGSGGGLNRPSIGDSGGNTYNLTVLGAVDYKTVEKFMQGIERVKRTKKVAA